MCTLFWQWFTSWCRLILIVSAKFFSFFKSVIIIVHFSGDYKRRRDLQEWTMAQRVLHLHTLSDESSWCPLYQPRWQAILCGLLWRTLRKTLLQMQQTHHRHRRHQIHLLRRQTLAQWLLLLCQLSDQLSRTWFHYRSRWHHLSRMCQAEADVKNI